MSFGALAYPDIDPVALRFAGLQVRWYGLAYVSAFAGSFFLARWIIRRWKLDISDDDMLSIILAAVIGVVVGGRLGYVLLYSGGAGPRNLVDVIAIWSGGMSFHGGLAGVLIAGLVVARRLHIPWLTLGDLGAACAPIGLFFGRLANFINDELWGRVTRVPWGVVFPSGGPMPRHPSQLYEAVLEGVVIFAVMIWLATRSNPPARGTMLGWLLTMYGAFRMLAELFRQPDVQIGFLPSGATMGQLLSVPVLIGGIALLFWVRRHPLTQEGRTD